MCNNAKWLALTDAAAKSNWKKGTEKNPAFTLSGFQLNLSADSIDQGIPGQQNQS